MKICYLIILYLLLLFSAVPMWGEGNDSIGYFVGIVNKFNRVFPQEKVYLHLDNTGYFVGETMWIKAYQTNTRNDSLGGKSDVVYVELIDGMGYVAYSIKIKMHNGVGNGQIILNEYPHGGFYEIRAYTRYMLNWGSDAIFSRMIPIFEKPKQEGDYSSPVVRDQYNDKEGSREGKRNKRKDLNVKFYPEGGHLVQGLPCRVAFELTDKTGRGVQAGCVLKDGEHELMRTQTGSDGRGIITCTPEATAINRLTLSVISSEGRHDDFPLPQPETSGITVKVDMMKRSTVPLTIVSSPDLQGQNVGVTLLNNGKIYFLEEHSLQGSQPLQLDIDRTEMKEGVSQLTVIDEHGRILASRMLFVFPRSKVSPISMKVDSVKGRTIMMTATAKPNTTFSVSVRDANDQVSGFNENAASWLLLASDLKGYIAHASYYLESDDDEHRRAADLLMMVQGWRRYNFHMMEGKENFAFDQPAEKQMILNGQIYPSRKSDAIANVSLDVIIGKAYDNPLTTPIKDIRTDEMKGHTQTDTLGRFRFTVPDCWGTGWRLWVIAAKEEEKRRNYLIGIDRQFSPHTRWYNPIEYDPIALTTPPISLQDAIDRGDLTIGVDSSHLLPQVLVTAKRWKGRSFWEREDVGADNSQIYYNCNVEAEKFKDKGQPVPSLIDFLRIKNTGFVGNDNISGYMPDDGNLLKNVFRDGISYGHRPVVWKVGNSFCCATGANIRSKNSMLDERLGGTRFTSEVFPYSLDEVNSVYVDLREHNDGYRTLFGNYPVYVNVYYKLGVQSKKKMRGRRKTNFDGLNYPETYEQVELQGIIPGADFRRTLYWNPNITTDATGHAAFEVLANSTCTDLYYSAEGITRDGSVVVSKP